MSELSDGRKCFQIGLAVLKQYRSVTDTHPASQPARHVAVAITSLCYRVEPKKQLKQTKVMLVYNYEFRLNAIVFILSL